MKAGVRQKDVADAVGRHEGTVTAWETGSQRPDEAVLSELAKVLNTSEDNLRNLMDQSGGTSGEPRPLDPEEVLRQLSRIEERSYRSEQERTNARESLAATIRAIASVQAEHYRQKEADAAERRAQAAIEDARARQIAEKRAYELTCRGTPSDDGHKGLDPRPRREELGGSGS